MKNAATSSATADTMVTYFYAEALRAAFDHWKNTDILSHQRFSFGLLMRHRANDADSRSLKKGD